VTKSNVFPAAKACAGDLNADGNHEALVVRVHH